MLCTARMKREVTEHCSFIAQNLGIRGVFLVSMRGEHCTLNFRKVT